MKIQIELKHLKIYVNEDMTPISANITHEMRKQKNVSKILIVKKKTIVHNR